MCVRVRLCVRVRACARARARVRVLHVFVYKSHDRTKQEMFQILESMNLRMMAKYNLKFCRDGKREGGGGGGNMEWR